MASIANADVVAYERDGVVCLRQVFDSAWVERLRRACRCATPDARYHPRPGTFQFPHKPDLAARSPMTSTLFPRVWPKTT